MASIQAKTSRGQRYYYIVESKRVNGKPRPVVLEYLGKPDTLLKRLRGESAIRIRSFAHGHVAALLAIAHELKVVETIDNHIPRNKWNNLPQRDGLTVGQTILLAAIGRACRPTSKRGWARWAKGSSLYLWRGKKLDDLTSQHFWDQMDAVPTEAIAKIERDIVQTVCQHYQVKPDLLLYDTTNFFTYISSTNSRSQLAKRGKNKQRRIDLRQIGLALMVSREHQLPLFHQVYEGSQVDVTTFEKLLQSLTDRLAFIFTEIDSLTIVYDKGNNSKKNQGAVDGQPYHYIASLTPSHHKALVAEANAAFEETTLPTGEVIKTYRVERDVWGAERVLVVYISERLRQGQTRGLLQWLKKRKQALDELSQELEKPNARPRDPDKLKAKIDQLLKIEKLYEIIRVTIETDKQGRSHLQYQVDQQKIDDRVENVFGRRIVMTDQREWSTAEIIMGFRGQAKVEDVFRSFKNPFHDAIRPQYHWTDQKIRVHVYCVILGYLLARLAYIKAKKEIRYEGSLENFLEELEHIRIAMIAEKVEKTPGPAKVRYQLENAEIEPLQQELIQLFAIEARSPEI
jgi:transposase